MKTVPVLAGFGLRVTYILLSTRQGPGNRPVTEKQKTDVYAMLSVAAVAIGNRGGGFPGWRRLDNSLIKQFLKVQWDGGTLSTHSNTVPDRCATVNLVIACCSRGVGSGLIKKVHNARL